MTTDAIVFGLLSAVELVAIFLIAAYGRKFRRTFIGVSIVLFIVVVAALFSFKALLVPLLFMACAIGFCKRASTHQKYKNTKPFLSYLSLGVGFWAYGLSLFIMP